MCLEHCQSAEQYSFCAWSILTKISCLPRWNYDKMLRLHHCYCCSRFLFAGLLRLTFVTLLISSSLFLIQVFLLLVLENTKLEGRKAGVWCTLASAAQPEGPAKSWNIFVLHWEILAHSTLPLTRALAWFFHVTDARFLFGLLVTSTWWWQEG